jgi:hypothetical protein
MEARACVHCHSSLEGAHPKRRFCSERCRKRVARRLARGVAADSYQQGKIRGQGVKLGQATAAERTALVLALPGA